jgi:hypothetical protein
MLDTLEPAESDERGFRPVTELYHWPLGAALLLAVVAALVAFTTTRWQWSRAAVQRWQGGLDHG